MPKLTQDFNIFPYFDDYDEAKSFYKIFDNRNYILFDTLFFVLVSAL